MSSPTVRELISQLQALGDAAQGLPVVINDVSFGDLSPITRPPAIYEPEANDLENLTWLEPRVVLLHTA